MESAIDSAQSEVSQHTHRIVADCLLQQRDRLVRVSRLAELISEANLRVRVLWLCCERLFVARNCGGMVFGSLLLCPRVW